MLSMTVTIKIDCFIGLFPNNVQDSPFQLNMGR